MNLKLLRQRIAATLRSSTKLIHRIDENVNSHVIFVLPRAQDSLPVLSNRLAGKGIPFSPADKLPGWQELMEAVLDSDDEEEEEEEEDIAVDDPPPYEHPFHYTRKNTSSPINPKNSFLIIPLTNPGPIPAIRKAVIEAIEPILSSHIAVIEETHNNHLLITPLNKKFIPAILKKLKIADIPSPILINPVIMSSQPITSNSSHQMPTTQDIESQPDPISVSSQPNTQDQEIQSDPIIPSDPDTQVPPTPPPSPRTCSSPESEQTSPNFTSSATQTRRRRRRRRRRTPVQKTTSNPEPVTHRTPLPSPAPPSSCSVLTVFSCIIQLGPAPTPPGATGVEAPTATLTDVRLLPWIARSPDLSPIKNVWDMVNDRCDAVTQCQLSKMNFGTRNWHKELLRAKLGRKPSFLRALVKTFAAEHILYSSIIILDRVVIRMLQPYFLGKVIQYFAGDKSIADEEAYIYASVLVFVSLLKGMLNNNFTLVIEGQGMRVSAACCSLIYRKVLKHNTFSMNQSEVGKVINLMANDAGRFETTVPSIPWLWVTVLQAIVVVYMVWQYMGPSSLFGMAVIIFTSLPTTWATTKLLSGLRRATAILTDERIKQMNEFLSGIQVIKMYAWEKPFAKLVSQTRKKEINEITKSSYIKSYNISSFMFIDKLSLIATLTSYSLLGNLVLPFKEFLMKDDASITTIQIFENKSESFSVGKITMKNCCASWSNKTYTLEDITLNVQTGRLCSIIGSVASGKSSLLHVLLGELPLTSGTLSKRGSMSYSSQEAWIFVGTVRQNILFGQRYDPVRYREVVRVCALERDFKMFPYGDKTLIGERGITLSGGQRARINLARAVYRDADIYVLDDPLSAVDSQVGKQIFSSCIKDFLKNKTRILVTHQLQYLHEADYVIVMDDGKIQLQGPPKELMDSNNHFTKFLADNAVEDTRCQEKSKDVAKKQTLAGDDNKEKSSQDKHEEALESSISMWKVYQQYIRAAGNPCILIFWFSFFTFGQVASNAVDIWLTHWSDTEMERLNSSRGSHTSVEEESYYFEVYWALLLITIIFALLRSVLFFRLSLKASKKIYDNMFRSILSATMRFFDTNPAGRILNRFSKDTYVMDEYLPSTMIFEFQNIRGLAGKENELVAEFERARLVVLALTETKRKSHGVDTMMNNHVLIYSGVSIRLRAKSGVALLIHKNFRNKIQEWKFHTDRILTVSIRLDPEIELMMFIVVYGVNDDVRKEEKDRFHGELQNVVDDTRGEIIVLGDLNGRVRNQPEGSGGAVGRHGEHVVNNNDCSPVYSHVTETLNGLTIIQASKAVDIMEENFYHLQDRNNASKLIIQAISSGVGLWLEVFNTLFLVALVISYFIVGGDSLTGGNVGLALSQTVLISGALQNWIKQFGEVATQMTSVERILEYTAVESESALESIPDKKPPDVWPERGVIVFSHVFLQYGRKDTPVLKDVSFTVQENHKVGIVGRTGAGKSSLIIALFRLANVEGSIIIDNVDTGSIGLHDLRKKISVIPQEPVLFSATLRYNLDPFDEFPDELLWKVLEDVELKGAIESLDWKITDRGSNLSVGQRQLVCLARAILRNSRILVLDEATANMDLETDALIQKTIRRKFQECTVLTIAHRLNTIMDSDKVLVMEGGTVVEYDHPYVLLQNKDSYFSKLVKDTGTGMEEKLCTMAQEAFQRANTSHEISTSESTKL
ncbi:ATP-binding cassette sub-family C member 4 [Anabrus simplex]|uniref:ATP-binding cassette sub-family C member 4 n=1 Tax=Anabrus simplex TaxID=316456 RepID=UPI0035A2ED8B